MDNRKTYMKSEMGEKCITCEVHGRTHDVLKMYAAITDGVFESVLHSVKGDTPEEIAKNSIEGILTTVAFGIIEDFSSKDIPKELKPYIKDALLDALPKFKGDITEYIKKSDDEFDKKIAEVEKKNKEAKTPEDVLEILGMLAELVESERKKVSKED